MLAFRLCAMLHPGPALRSIRQSQDKTLEDVAAALDSDTGNLSKKERGLDDIPQRVLVAWCEYLGVKPSDVWLITEKSADGTAHELARLAKLLSKIPAKERESLVDQAEYFASRSQQRR